MKDVRPGEELWEEWDGDGYESVNSYTTNTYFTFDFVDIDHDVVRRALASSLQRDGICHSLSDGFKSLENASPTYGWVGYLYDEEYLTVCDEDGDTPYGDALEEVKAATWVELVV